MLKTVDNKVLTPQINNITMKMPNFALMLETNNIDDSNFCNSSTIKSSSCEKKQCSCTHVLQVKLNSMVEVILIDEGRLLHKSYEKNFLRGFFGVKLMKTMCFFKYIYKINVIKYF